MPAAGWIHAFPASFAAGMLSSWIRGSSHGAVLTEAGRAFREDAQALDQAARAALSRVGPRHPEAKHLRVTARGCDVGTLGLLVTSYNAAHGGHAPARPAVVDKREHIDEVRGRPRTWCGTTGGPARPDRLGRR
jgi:hypothetical protein